MRMPFWGRIGLGALLGLCGLGAATALGGAPWVTASVAALAAAVGFLGSFFVVSADRPEAGYEQVLFDRPNTLVTGLLVVALAGAGLGAGALGPGEPPAPPTPPDHVYALRADYQTTADAWTGGDAWEPTLATIATLREESDRIALELAELPEGDERELLEKANDALAFALDALKTCAENRERNCTDARIRAADAASALQDHAALSAA